jgi:hypothetical protein
VAGWCPGQTSPPAELWRRFWSRTTALCPSSWRIGRRTSRSLRPCVSLVGSTQQSLPAASTGCPRAWILKCRSGCIHGCWHGSNDIDQTDLIPEIRPLSVISWPLEVRREVRVHRCPLLGSVSIRDQIRDQDSTGRCGTDGDGCDVDGVASTIIGDGGTDQAV